MVKMILKIPKMLNEALLDEVAQLRKIGQKSSKEKIIIKLLKQNYDKE